MVDLDLYGTVKRALQQAPPPRRLPLLEVGGASPAGPDHDLVFVDPHLDVLHRLIVASVEGVGDLEDARQRAHTAPLVAVQVVPRGVVWLG